MKRWQPYFNLLRGFGADLVKLGCRVGRQVILPGRQRTGNLLSSLFLLFAGLTEQLIGLRRELLRIPFEFRFAIPAEDRLQAAWQYSKRWIRLGMVVAGWALFILSSLEWSSPAAPETAPSAQCETVVSREQRAVVVQATREDRRAATVADFSFSCALPVARDVGVARRWLLLCSLRI